MEDTLMRYMSKRLTYEELEQRVQELEASQTLREQSRIGQSIDSIQAGVVVHGKNGTVIKSNTTAQIMLGLTREQMLGKELTDTAWTFLREDGSPMPVEEYPVSRVLKTKKPVHNLVVGIQQSDKAEPMWVLDTAIPEFDENGHLSQIVTTFMDISALKKSEERYRNLFENMMHEVHLWKLVRDEQGAIKTWRLVEVNPAALKAWGKTRPEIIGKTTNEIFSYDATEQFMPIVKKIFSEGTPYTWEAYFPPTGQFYHMTSVSFGEYFISTGTDITDRKQIEDALRESEERHRLFYNPSFGGSIIHDRGRILDFSKGVINITGYSYDELVGMDGLLLIAPDWRDLVMDKIISGSEESYEVEGIRKDGTIFPLRLHAKAIQYHGKPARVVEFRDISDIKKAEQALKKSERLLRNVIDTSTDYIFVKDKELKTILCNRKFAQGVNKEPSELIGKTDLENGWDAELLEGNPDKEIIGYHQYDLEVLSGKIVQNTITAIVSGETRFLHSVKIPLKDENNQIFGVLGINRDVTEQKKVEQALKASEEQFRTLVNESPFPVVVLDAAGENILHWSKSAQELFGHQPQTPAEWFSLAYPDPQYRQEVMDRSQPYLERMQHSTTAVNTGEYHITCRDGSVKICEIYAQLISGHLVLTNNDITDRKQAEAEIHAAREFLNTLIDLSMFGMWISDRDGTVIQVNRIVCETLNIPDDQIVGTYNVFQDDNLKAQGVMPKVQSVFETHQPAHFTIFWQGTKINDIAFQAARDMYIDVYMFPIMDSQGKLKNVVCQWVDISELKNAENQLREMVEFDALTQVYSRQHLLDLAERMFMRIKQGQTSLVCMMFDIDHFKSINDRYGHKTGDIALIAFSEIISKNIRCNDIFGRLGGEEFLAVIPEISLEAGQKLAERIRIEVEKTPIMAGVDCITMTVSIGISMYKKAKNFATFGELIELSDKALYEAKNSGRNRVCVDNT
ncbi:sensor domain-containing diguanylate cyclase [Roseofilum capinflatum]|uniref:PAS domain S-box protein n=1 Tax=Roseofilum capinflatum BLCC-M114 TaxID=3022440 RepID=A0ABT7B496_9CYAN|nr:PAS domain S-box protein [Roseofilum capinflatum]MDJ1174003.1 PAS domain S-box protein [Roseofilum capinflatum BLCC-M114]MDJ1177068.1 PAS domain S-box protein [Roseofilum capinflatum BLCC-M114]